MRKAAPWIAVAGVAALLVADIVLVSVLRSEVSALSARVGEPVDLREEVGRLAGRVEALEKPGNLAAGRPAPVARAPAASLEEEETDAGLEPPRGTLVATFDETAQGWKRPDWASGSVLRATSRGTFRRGGGALALGYVYGETPAAAAGPVNPGGKVRHVRFYARTRGQKMVLGVGVEEAGGARYELRLPPLAPGEGWRLVSAPPGVMGPARGSRDADRKLDLTKIVGVYVVDRTKDAGGGNVLLVDDVTIELFE